MPISLSGFNGIDTDSLISQLMQIEEIPLTRMQNDKNEINTKINVWQKINSGLSTLQNKVNDLEDIFNEMSPVSEDEEIITATANSTAQSGSYDIEVKTLAQKDVNVADPSPTGDITSDLGYYGDLNISSSNGSFSITVAETDSLADIMDKINNAASNENTNSDSENYEEQLVEASIIDNRLVIKSAAAGSNNILTIDDSALKSNNGTSGDTSDDTAVSFNFNNKQQAADSEFIIDGITINRESNQIDDVIKGVTINLEGESDTGVKTTLTVGADKEDMKEKIKAFVDQYNSIQDQLNNYGGKEGILQGDAALRSIQSALYNSTVLPSSTISSDEWLNNNPLSTSGNLVINGDTISLTGNETTDEIVQAVNDLNKGYTAENKDNKLVIRSGSSMPVDLSGSSSQILKDLKMPEEFKSNSISLFGVEIDKEGKLSIDDEKLDEALEDNLSDVEQMFAGVDGVMDRLGTSIDYAVDSFDGYINGRIDSLEKEVEYIDEDIESMQTRLDMREERLRAQFTRMDQLVTQLNNQGSWLSSQFDSLS